MDSKNNEEDKLQVGDLILVKTYSCYDELHKCRVTSIDGKDIVIQDLRYSWKSLELLANRKYIVLKKKKKGWLSRILTRVRK